MARPGLRNHPKFRRLAHMLGMPAVYVEAHLHAMWTVGYEDGNPVLGDETDVELAAEWQHSGRERGEFFRAVLDCRLIDDLGDGRYQIHDLLEHAPDYVRKRAKRHSERRGGRKVREPEVVAANGDADTLPEIDIGECPPNGAERRTTADNVRRCPPTPDCQSENGGTPAPAPAPKESPQPPLGEGGADPPKRKRNSEPPPPVPAELDTPEFHAAWSRWEKHRRQKGAKLTTVSIDQQFKQLAGMGVARAVAAIEHTIFKGWTGLREPDNPPRAPPAPAETLEEKLARQYAEADRRTGLPRQGKVTGADLFGRNGRGAEF